MIFFCEGVFQKTTGLTMTCYHVIPAQFPSLTPRCPDNMCIWISRPDRFKAFLRKLKVYDSEGRNARYRRQLVVGLLRGSEASMSWRKWASRIIGSHGALIKCELVTWFVLKTAPSPRHNSTPRFIFTTQMWFKIDLFTSVEEDTRGVFWIHNLMD